MGTITKKLPIVNIIIVTFNSENYITNCVDSLISSCNGVTNFSISIIDNASNDKTVEIIKSRYLNNQNITLHTNLVNIGFAEAVNQGINEKIKYDYLLLVNPDIVSTNDTIKKILSCQRKHHAGIVGVKTINKLGHKSGSYFRFPTLLVGIFDFTNLRKIDWKDIWHKYFYYLDKKEIHGDFPVDVITGGFMLITKKSLINIGKFDEQYYMYLEDVDYCLRANRLCVDRYVCDTTVMHIGGASSINEDGIRHSAWLMSRKRYFLKNFNIFSNLIIQPIFLLDDIIIHIILLLKSL